MFLQELECFDVPLIVSLIDGSKGENDGIKIDNQICIGYKHQFDLINEKNGDTLQLFQTDSNKVFKIYMNNFGPLICFIRVSYLVK